MERVVSKSQQIQDLVQKMKAGEITKSELFAELSKIQRNDRKRNGAPSTSHPQHPSSPSKQSMQRLFEEKRLERQNRSRHVSPRGATRTSQRNDPVASQHNPSAQPQISTQQHSPRKQTPVPHPQHEPQTRRQVIRVGRETFDASPAVVTAEDRQRFQGPHEHARRGPPQHANGHHTSQPATDSQPRQAASRRIRPHSAHARSRSTPRSSTPNSFRDASRTPRPTEQRKVDECTFRPKIKELPTYYSGKTESYKRIPLEHRTMQWREQKLQAAAKRFEQEQERELEECTFRPNINHSSRVTVSQTRNSFDGHEQMPTSERLYSESKRNRKAELQAKYRAEREAKLRAECTFQPNINRRYPTPVRSRYRDATPKKSRALSSPTPQDQELTFTPKVNPIPDSMNSAKQYTSTDIFERLSRTRGDGDAAGGHGSNQDESQHIMDISTFLSTQGTSAGNGRRRRPASAPRTRPRRGELASPRGSVSSEQRREQSAKFQSFLARQNQRELIKQRNMQELEKRTNPTFKPELCQKSLKVAQTSRQGSFLQRMAKDAVRKEHQARKLKIDRAEDPECTFKPKITKAARKMKARTTTELSRGDSLRRETNTRLMKLKAEQDEVAGHTFRPHLNTNRAEGRLKILSEPETYVQRLQREAKVFSEKQRRAAQEQEMIEFAECTFHPKIHDAPAYVKRIAESMALTRNSRNKAESETNQRPDWR